MSSKEYWLVRWNLPEAAAAAGLTCETDLKTQQLVGKEFDASEFPGYQHRETHADTSAGSTEKGITVVFSKG